MKDKDEKGKPEAVNLEREHPISTGVRRRDSFETVPRRVPERGNTLPPDVDRGISPMTDYDQGNQNKKNLQGNLNKEQGQGMQGGQQGGQQQGGQQGGMQRQGGQQQGGQQGSQKGNLGSQQGNIGSQQGGSQQQAGGFGQNRKNVEEEEE